MGASSDWVTGGAWLSSARVVRCWVKSRNERNPCSMLPARSFGGGGDSWETAGVNSEEGAMTSSHHAPYVLGCKHATMAGTEGC